jgi:hypothetical protein
MSNIVLDYEKAPVIGKMDGTYTIDALSAHAC